MHYRVTVWQLLGEKETEQPQFFDAHHLEELHGEGNIVNAENKITGMKNFCGRGAFRGGSFGGNGHYRFVAQLAHFLSKLFDSNCIPVIVPQHGKNS